MDEYKILEIKESVFADNDREADALRASLKERGQFLLNLMSSPGSGKTTTLGRTIEALGDELALAVMEADIDSNVDAALAFLYWKIDSRPEASTASASANVFTDDDEVEL